MRSRIFWIDMTRCAGRNLALALELTMNRSAVMRIVVTANHRLDRKPIERRVSIVDMSFDSGTNDK